MDLTVLQAPHRFLGVSPSGEAARSFQHGLQLAGASPSRGRGRGRPAAGPWHLSREGSGGRALPAAATVHGGGAGPPSWHRRLSAGSQRLVERALVETRQAVASVSPHPRGTFLGRPLLPNSVPLLTLAPEPARPASCAPGPHAAPPPPSKPAPPSRSVPARPVPPQPGVCDTPAFPRQPSHSPHCALPPSPVSFGSLARALGRRAEWPCSGRGHPAEGSWAGSEDAGAPLRPGPPRLRHTCSWRPRQTLRH